MKKEQFVELYKTLTVNELCKQLGCSTTTIYALLERYNIPKKGNKYRDYGHCKGARYKLD